jgi:hypothetical protein
MFHIFWKDFVLIAGMQAAAGRHPAPIAALVAIMRVGGSSVV